VFERVPVSMIAILSGERMKQRVTELVPWSVLMKQPRF